VSKTIDLMFGGETR